MRTALFTIVCIINTHLAFGQKWVKTYGDSGYYANFAAETYDHGFIIGASCYANPTNAVIFKTDINGNTLWRRNIGNQEANMGGICLTQDGGAAIVGNYAVKDKISDLFLLKLNSCGETEWIKRYEQQAECYGYEVAQLKNGGFVFDYSLKKTEDDYYGGLFRTDANGKIIWKYFNYASPTRFLVEENNDILITANSFYTQGSHQVPVSTISVTKLDSNGYQLWEYLQRDYYNFGLKTLPYPGKNYITVGTDRHYPDQMDIHLFTWDSTGHLLKTIILQDTLRDNFPIDMLKINDSSYLILSEMFPTSAINCRMRILKINGVGKTINEVVYNGDTYDMRPVRIIPTSDGKYLTLGDRMHDNNAIGIYASKITGDLMQDSFNKGVLRYDSLCPKSIADTGTISLNHPEIVKLYYDKNNSGYNKGALSIYPNPARDILNFSFRGLSNAAVDASLYDILGRTIASYQFQPDKTGAVSDQISLKHMARGTYLLRITQDERSWFQKLIVY